MTDKKIWLVTGAARGMGVDIATAALAAGHAVVATARNPDAVTAALGDHDELLAVQLDITDPASVDAAIAAAVDRFGRIDVLVNNAGNFYAGYFEEISPAQMRAQIETNLFGPMNVTRAVLPVMRRQRSGHVVTISSTAGLIGQEFVAAYAASKFGVEGWMESLRFDVEPFGIHTTIVEPGFFRTELLVEGSSTIWPELSIDDYTDRTQLDHRGVAWHERPTRRRPRQARRGSRHHHRARRATAAVRRRRRRRRRRRAESTRPARPDRRPPRPVHQPRPRRRPGMTNATANRDEETARHARRSRSPGRGRGGWVRRATEQVPSTAYGEVDLERDDQLRAHRRQYSAPESLTAGRRAGVPRPPARCSARRVQVADERSGVQRTSRSSSVVAPGPGTARTDRRSRVSPHALQVICPVVTQPQLRCSMSSGSLPSP